MDNIRALFPLLNSDYSFQLLYKKDDLIGENIEFSDIRNVHIQGNYLTGYHSKEYKGVHSLAFLLYHLSIAAS